VIVLGIDPHKKSHTAVALEATTGEFLDELTVQTTAAGQAQLLGWARRLGPERRFALEDCRHLTGRLERFLIERGEASVRVPPKLMAKTRQSARTRGKSDAIDAAAVARAALREPHLPEACLPGPERELRLLADHRSDLVGERTRIQGRLRWHLHDLALELEVPAKALGRACWLARLEEALSALPAGVQVRIACELTERCRTLSAEIDALEREITQATAALAPELLALPGCGALTAACLVGETAGALRFASEARFAMHAGVAPVPVSSGRSDRYRLNRRGNRQLNCALHRIAVTQLRMHEPARAFMARKRAEGKTKREALRCLKRHLARTVWRALCASETRRQAMLDHQETSTQPALALAS
jgi:transposase